MATTANFFSTPRTAFAQISTANTNRDGSGTIGTVISGASSGTRVDDLEIVATGANLAGVVRLYIHDGTNARLWREIIVPATTPSVTVPVFSVRLTDMAVILQNASWSIRASTNNAEAFNLLVTRAGDA
jgi:hypothetical protein